MKTSKLMHAYTCNREERIKKQFKLPSSHIPSFQFILHKVERGKQKKEIHPQIKLNRITKKKMEKEIHYIR